jgi:hypothetical protein
MATVIDGTTGTSIAGASTAVGNFSVGGNLTVTGTITGSGAVSQIVNSSTGAVATGTTLIPSDDTIPQITEGDQYMTLAVTPRSATSKLVIEVVVQVASSAAGGRMSAALFQDATANALAVSTQGFVDANKPMMLSFTHYMTSGTTSATTFRVRVGASVAGTTTFNGASGARLYGGVSSSSITITEVAA